MITLLAIATLAGCRNWSPESPGAPALRSSRPLPDSVALEVWVAELPPNEAARLIEVWKSIDCQCISVDARRALDRNGIRCGVAPVETRMLVRSMVRGTLDIQNRSGQTQDIDVAPTQAMLNWSVEKEDGQIRTGSCENATCCLAITGFPSADGTAILKVKPKVRYGSPRNRYTVDNNQFSLRPILDELDFSELAFHVRVKPGQTLVLGPTEQSSGMGSHLFVDPQTRRTRLLLIRLVYAAVDDRFASGSFPAPITTE